MELFVITALACIICPFLVGRLMTAIGRFLGAGIRGFRDGYNAPVPTLRRPLPPPPRTPIVTLDPIGERLLQQGPRRMAQDWRNRN